MLLASDDFVEAHGIKPRARIRATATIGSEPVIMLTAPTPASERALKKAGMTVKDIDLWEINEAFAAVPLQTMRKLAIDPDRASDVSTWAAAGDTTALCVVDGDGVGVSLIQSNASGFGSHLFEPATGINLHNRGLGFSVEAGHPAEYAPRRQPPHTLTPALVTTLDGRLAAVLGTMGGDSQPQVLLQLLARALRRVLRHAEEEHQQRHHDEAAPEAGVATERTADQTDQNCQHRRCRPQSYQSSA